MRYCLIALLWVLLTPAGSAQITVRDAMDRTLVLEKPATRVISLAPHITEVVYAAGAGEQLVGAVSYSDYPEAARAIPRVGSYDSVSYETLLTLKPDLVLAWHEGNGEDVVTRLQSLGLNVYVGEPRALEDVAESLRVIGVLTGNEQVADAAASRFMQQLHALRETYSSREPVTVYYQIWNEPLLTLNGDHLISDVVRLCGGRNVFADAMPLVSRISVESVLRANPQVIIASGMDKARPEWLDDWREWSAMTAVRNDQLYFIPPDILQRHTPRIIEGATLMCEKLQQAREHYAMYAP
ncbi:cobalamin-binding protein [Candidatus Marimicrobium litorale]|uniref:Cobalamin-binding protein n=1 Tax=Candidatus Marimicrobium litorale TaxID=2518991 RepID=A0ABT3T3D6_9GAMM|nr:cobalamin-binding protein [Candidatus Marimicrobium litorale]MCX2976052.1 cobalamin-binding protein [Candidatus Marimicrobium litorale]